MAKEEMTALTETRTPEAIAAEVYGKLYSHIPESHEKIIELQEKDIQTIADAIHAERDQKPEPSKSLEDYTEENGFTLENDFTQGEIETIKKTYTAGITAERARVKEAWPTEIQFIRELYNTQSKKGSYISPAWEHSFYIFLSDRIAGEQNDV